MSFSATIPPTVGFNEFVDAVDGAKVSPKIDRRTTAGKLEATLADAAKEALVTLAEESIGDEHVGTYAGSISGHVYGVVGSIQASFSFGPAPSE